MVGSGVLLLSGAKKEGAMRPLGSSLYCDRLFHLPVHHVLAQSGPGQQEAQSADAVQAGHDDHGGLQALGIDLSADVLQVLGQLTDDGGVTLVARQFASRYAEVGDAGIEEDV